MQWWRTSCSQQLVDETLLDSERGILVGVGSVTSWRDGKHCERGPRARRVVEYTRCTWAGGTSFASFPDFCDIIDPMEARTIRVWGFSKPRALLTRAWCGEKKIFFFSADLAHFWLAHRFTDHSHMGESKAREVNSFCFFENPQTRGVRASAGSLILSIPPKRGHLVPLGLKKKKLFFFSCPQPLALDSRGDSPQTTASNWHHSTASIIIAARVLVLSSAVSGNNRHRPHPPIALLLALHRYRGGRGQTAQAPRGEGRAPPSKIASRRTLPPDSLSHLLVRVFLRESSASGWGQLEKKRFF